MQTIVFATRNQDKLKEIKLKKFLKIFQAWRTSD